MKIDMSRETANNFWGLMTVMMVVGPAAISGYYQGWSGALMYGFIAGAAALCGFMLGTGVPDGD